MATLRHQKRRDFHMVSGFGGGMGATFCNERAERNTAFPDTEHT